ncbi:AraC family ligand binding domain-containing protein [Pseudomonas sp. DB1]|uniref:AraC family ligand binding domain-containing protein n=1 Tax=Metapseudomonas boanensis TaxID=2822138 RepID=A0ABS5XC33_9GAMM|nr:AraC family ligand binding domain-containing protein [Pseudomonas boanensis]MBT8765252.1 AraC family ligand binding domain-containing protein [Pseudomonas boanensis]
MEQISHILSSLPGVRLIDAEHHSFRCPRHFHLEYHLGLLVHGRQRYLHQGEKCQADARCWSPGSS